MMHDVGIPAASLAIIENNKIVFYNVYGYRQLSTKSKADKKTLFEACSLSKSYLVYTVFKLADEGKIDLDRPMYQYLDPGPSLNHDPRYKLITPRMVLSHTSGIENWKEDNNKDTLEILSNPGEKFLYSGTGYNYLAAVVETILKEPYEQYIKEMVIKPLELKGTYVKFEKRKGKIFHHELPWNYALGYDAFGTEYKKFKNRAPVPSSYDLVTAEDYAKLIIGIFDYDHLSEKSRKDILEPRIRTVDHRPYFYGPGFEVIYTDNDTIIGHGGSNLGFRGQVFYSVVNKRGFVLLTNSDRGKMMTERLCGISAGLNIHEYYQQFSFDHYPSVAIDLFNIYKTKDSSAMFAEIDELSDQGKLDANTLNALADAFIKRNTAMSQKLLTRNILLFPRSSLSYFFLGNIYRKEYEVDSAYKYYLKAKEMGFDLWADDLVNDLAACKKEIADAETRKPILVNIDGAGATIIHTERYNAMHGIELRAMTDTGRGHIVSNMEPGNWLDYNINVSKAGTYEVRVRVASMPGGGQMELRSGAVVLSKLDIASTKGWKKWTTLTVHAVLAEGSQTLRLYVNSGGFNINWLQFIKVEDNVKL